MAEFAHLHVHTQYSFLVSTVQLHDLAPRVKELGMRAVAVTDHQNMFGAIRHYKLCKNQGIQAILGSELNIARAGDKAKAKRPDQPKMQEAAKHLIEGHTLLDNVVNRAGLLLGHTLPTEASDEQKGFLAEMDAATGDEFDAVFANRLRAAPGKV